MKWIKYKREIHVINKNDSLQDTFLQEEMRSFSDETRDAIVEKVSEIAYNGEYEIIDDGKPEPVIPPTNEELAAENKLLKQQVSALTDQQSFYEDCIAEMATVVYA